MKSVKSKAKCSAVTPVPEIVENKATGKKFKRGKFLGKDSVGDLSNLVVTLTKSPVYPVGGFARCYELTNEKTKEVFAGKVICKQNVLKPEQRQKIAQEISIHGALKHKNIVDFHGFFEDVNFIYIILEYCSQRSLMEMQQRRSTLTDPEIRYFVRQIAEAGAYLHQNSYVHRDLKLGNLLINSKMELKVGDFGLATRVDPAGEKKLTMCGTPNYIAPEILTKKGHSFEVDVWSLGCIIYTLAVGTPPFESSSLQLTYTLIKNNEYKIPAFISVDVRDFIRKLLHPDPKQRPKMCDILMDPFLTKAYIPSRIPDSCLSIAPRFESRVSFCISQAKVTDGRKLTTEGVRREATMSQKEANIKRKANRRISLTGYKDAILDAEKYLVQLSHQLTDVLKSNPSSKPEHQFAEAEDPAGSPIFWISKWVDYSDKYGLGYQLCDNSTGILFNDCTRIVLFPDELSFQYVERNGNEHYHTFSNHPPELQKKVTLLRYFQNYMSVHLLRTGEAVCSHEDNKLMRLPYVLAWFRTKSSIIFLLSNGIVQVNFSSDHIKLILCPLMGAITFVNQQKEFHTFRLKLIETFGCSGDLALRIKYAQRMVARLIECKQDIIGNLGKYGSE